MTLLEQSVELLNHIQGEDVLVIQVQEDNLDASNVRAFRDGMQALCWRRSKRSEPLTRSRIGMLSSLATQTKGMPSARLRLLMQTDFRNSG